MLRLRSILDILTRQILLFRFTDYRRLSFTPDNFYFISGLIEEQSGCFWNSRMFIRRSKFRFNLYRMAIEGFPWQSDRIGFIESFVYLHIWRVGLTREYSLYRLNGSTTSTSLKRQLIKINLSMKLYNDWHLFILFGVIFLWLGRSFIDSSDSLRIFIYAFEERTLFIF